MKLIFLLDSFSPLYFKIVKSYIRKNGKDLEIELA